MINFRLLGTFVVVVAASLASSVRSESHPLGSIEIELRSAKESETRSILHALLGATDSFLYASFRSSTDGTFQQVSCSIGTYVLGRDNDIYTANVTVTGFAIFSQGTSITAPMVSDLTMMAFVDDNAGTLFTDALASTDDPFLSSITYAAVNVEGASLVAGDVEDDSGGLLLEVWMLPLLGGAGAFILVLCCIVTCICCMKVDDTEKNNTVDKNPTPSKNQMNAVLTIPTSNPEDEEDRGMESVSPSEVKSIGSQDSSLFTYNPHSVRSFDNRTANSYAMSQHGIEVDAAAWQNSAAPKQEQISFGQDISSIAEQPSKRDLSLIQEGEDESTSSPLCLSVGSGSKSRASSGKYKSLLGCVSRMKLTEGAINEMEQEERHGIAPRGIGQKNQNPVFSMGDPDDKDSDSDSDNSSFFGPSQIGGTSKGSRLNLSGSAAEVLYDLNSLSTEIDQYRLR